jgi:hypothetical protein
MYSTNSLNNTLKFLLGDFNAEVGRKDIFEPTLAMRVCMKLLMIMKSE